MESVKVRATRIADRRGHVNGSVMWTRVYDQAVREFREVLEEILAPATLLIKHHSSLKNLCPPGSEVIQALDEFKQTSRRYLDELHNLKQK